MSKRIGELLEENGIIDNEKIRYVLAIQKTVKKRVGDLLVELNFVTDQDVAKILSKQSGVPFKELYTYEPSKDALEAVPYNFSIQNDILPVAIENDTLMVAIADPYNERAKTMLGRFSSRPIAFFVSPKSEISKNIEKFYYLAAHPIDEAINLIRKNLINNLAISVENLVNLLIESAIYNRSSDIHITPTEQTTLVSYRIDGVMHLFYALPPSIHTRIISTIKIKSSMDIAKSNSPQDGSMSDEIFHEQYSFRVSTVPTIRGENLVIRILGGDNKIALHQIGFGERQLSMISKAIKSPFGIILVTGPTGSGKTTTLYALLQKINYIEKNVMAIEDPVEYKMSLIHQVAINEKAQITFASAIRSFLRQDPDVMLIGEIRDEETAALATKAALTGHLVLSTLHTNDAVGAISRLSDLKIGSFLLSSSITAIIAQRLLRKLCPFCKKEYSVDDWTKKKHGITNIIYRHIGCGKCAQTGYTGRVAASEIILIDNELRLLIAGNRPPSDFYEYTGRKGVKTMRDSAIVLLKQGITDLTEIERVFGV